MNAKSDEILNRLIGRYPQLKSCRSAIEDSSNLLIETYQNKGKLLISGNGGSSSDSDHIVGELGKSFILSRPLSDDFKNNILKVDNKLGIEINKHLEEGLPALSLTSQTALTSAFSNDQNSELVYAQQVLVFGDKNDVLLAISTSGNSKNVIYAAIVAQAKSIPVIALTGKTGGNLKDFADIIINVPESETFIIQELHLPIYHCITQIIENEFFGEENWK